MGTIREHTINIHGPQLGSLLTDIRNTAGTNVEVLGEETELHTSVKCQINQAMMLMWATNSNSQIEQSLDKDAWPEAGLVR